MGPVNTEELVQGVRWGVQSTRPLEVGDKLVSTEACAHQNECGRCENHVVRLMHVS